MVPFTIVDISVASQITGVVLGTQSALVYAPGQSCGAATAGAPGHHLRVAAVAGRIYPVANTECELDRISGIRVIGIDALVTVDVNIIINAVQLQRLT